MIISIKDRLEDLLDLSKYRISVYNKESITDKYLFSAERDLESYLQVVNGIYYSKDALKELENYILLNVNKMKITTKEFCTKLYTTSRGVNTMSDYEDMVKCVKYNKSKKKLNKSELLEGLMHFECNNYVGEFEIGLTAEEYFEYLYDVYKSMGGSKEYIKYYKKEESGVTIYTFEETKEKKGAFVENREEFILAIEAVNNINKGLVYMVEEKGTDLNVVIGKDGLYRYLCELKGLGLNNFKYLLLKLAVERGNINKGVKSYKLGNSYVHKLNLKSYEYKGYSEDGELLFKDNSNKKLGLIVFKGEDLYDDVEYKLYNLEQKIETLKCGLNSLETRVEKVGDKLSYMLTSYMNGSLEEYRHKVMEENKEFEDEINAIYRDAWKTNQNVRIMAAYKSGNVPKNYHFDHFHDGKAIFYEVEGYHQNEAIYGRNSIEVVI